MSPEEKEEISPVITPPSEAEDLIPDWLKPATSVASEPTLSSIDEDGLDTSIPILPPPSPDAELPDWLKNSIDTTTDSPE